MSVDADTLDTVGAWRDGGLLVVERGAALPQRCIRTNEPVAGYLTTRLLWHTPAWYLALVLIPGAYVIYLLMFAAGVEVTCGLSRRVLDRRRATLAGGWVAFACGPLLAAARYPSPTWVIAGVVLMFSGLALLTAGTRLLWATRMESGFAWIRGAHPDFLAGLPQWPGPPGGPIQRTAQG